MTKSRQIASAAICLLLCGGCGYHVGGHADTLPRGIRSIAIPAFSTTSIRYRLVDMLPQELTREFRARSRFEITSDPAAADAVLRGTVNGAGVYPAAVDQASGKATSVFVTVNVSTSLVERATNRVLLSKPNVGFRQNYSIAIDPHQFFDESGPAFDRLSRDLARDLVSAILSDF